MDLLHAEIRVEESGGEGNLGVINIHINADSVVYNIQSKGIRQTCQL